MIQTNKTQEDFILLPDPERIVNGLRDTGYNFDTAIADIVDNSISANATTVNIHIEMDPNQNVRVYIADDGECMDLDGLKNAMKYGSKAREEANSLGKFGLGLKTASTAFGRCLSLLSRNNSDNTLRKVQWDLDYIAAQGQWLLQFPEIDVDEEDFFENTAQGGPGTLVIWDKIDRLLKDYKTEANAKKALNRTLDKLRFHLSMVFQRYLDINDTRASNIRIVVNDVEILPWDPFCRKEEKTELLQEQVVPVEMPDGSKPTFYIAAYIIPKKGEYSSREAEVSARGSNDFQGIYVYRENRLIHFGDWFGLMKNEPHFSLLRLDFSFDYQLDEILSVDIKKSRILLIGELASFIEKFLGSPRREAEKRYRDKETKLIDKTSKEVHKPSNQAIDASAKNIVNAKFKIVGEDKAEVTNPQGTFTKTIVINDQVDPKQARVIAVPSIESNALWAPAIVNQQQAVYINESHPFYKKVYGPYLQQNVVVQGLDYILWALAEAESSTCNAATIENYEDMRYTVSRNLKKLVENLPDPEIVDPED